jgi:hypothetical protein
MSSTELPIERRSDVYTEKEDDDKEQSVEARVSPTVDEKQPEAITYPEGGARAWSVALACGGIVFCTFGYVNSFGYVVYA